MLRRAGATASDRTLSERQKGMKRDRRPAGGLDGRGLRNAEAYERVNGHSRAVDIVIAHACDTPPLPPCHLAFVCKIRLGLLAARKTGQRLRARRPVTGWPDRSVGRSLSLACAHLSKGVLRSPIKPRPDADEGAPRSRDWSPVARATAGQRQLGCAGGRGLPAAPLSLTGGGAAEERRRVHARPGAGRVVEAACR